MINIGDLVIWKDHCLKIPGIITAEKTRKLDGLNKKRMLQVHFSNKDVHWIIEEKIKKLY